MLLLNSLDLNFRFFSEAPALLKILYFFIAWVGLWLPIALPLGLALRWNPLRSSVTPAQKFPLLASLYLILPFVLWGIATVEGTTIAQYGLTGDGAMGRSLLVGFILGVLGLAAMVGVQWGLGWLKLQTPPLSSSVLQADQAADQQVLTGHLFLTKVLLTVLLPTFFISFWISFTEELVFRGFLLNQLQQDYRLWVAAIIASLIFALLHLVWEGQERVPQLPGLCLMGLILTLARWVDGNQLGLAIGLHAGWIWTVASLDATQIISYTGRGAEWLTGLDGNPLAGVMGILFLLATGGFLWAFFS